MALAGWRPPRSLAPPISSSHHRIRPPSLDALTLSSHSPHARTACHSAPGPAAAGCSPPSLLSPSRRLPVVSFGIVSRLWCLHVSWTLSCRPSSPAGSGCQARRRRAAADAHGAHSCRCAKACPDQAQRSANSHLSASRRTARQTALVLHRSIDAPSPQVVWLVHLKHA
jgi:hypothetical protein